MAPRITRPRNDRPLWPLVGGIGMACIAAGYVAGARVFDPGSRAHDEDESETAAGPDESHGHAQEPPAGASDAGVAANPVANEPTAPVAAPRVAVRITSSVTQSCGDGEELNIPGARCEAVNGVDAPVRAHLQRLGDCPGAEAAAQTPNAVLSIGLRVDFARHRVTALPGHSSSVRNAMTFVPCARAAFEHADDLWALTASHPRYLYFYSVRFAPTGTATPSPSTATPAAPSPSVATPTVTSAPATPTPAPSDTPPPAATTPSAPVHGTPLAQAEAIDVVWERVVVRDAPRTGNVVGHLVRGDHITLVGRQNGWFEIRFGDHSGWIFGAAVGR